MTNIDSDLIFYQPTLTTGEDDPVKAKYKTPQGKEIVVKSDGKYGMYIIQFTSGGQPPKEFDSLFTTVEQAEIVIKKYIQDKEALEKEPEQDVKQKGKQAL